MVAAQYDTEAGTTPLETAKLEGFLSEPYRVGMIEFTALEHPMAS